MDEKRVIESLSPIERALLPSLTKEYTDLKQLAEKAGTDTTTALRAAEFLKNKKPFGVLTTCFCFFFFEKEKTCL